MRTLRVATRSSALAMIQTRLVTSAIEAQGHAVEIVSVSTRGDRDAVRAIAAIGSDGVFVKELEHALVDGRADVAVHSMKDLPTDVAAGLTIGAVLAREDARDALISAGNAYPSLAALPSGAVVGTSSLRRRAIVCEARPDVQAREMRGNVDTRVRKVLGGEYDAAVLAFAGLKRLGLLDAVWGGAPLPVDEMVPAVGQGAVCAQCRADDAATLAVLAPLDDARAALETSMERALLRRMGGGCLVPIGAHARVLDGSYALYAVVAAPDGSSAVRRTVQGRLGPGVEATAVAERVADEMLAAGGRELVDAFRAALARES